MSMMKPFSTKCRPRSYKRANRAGFWSGLALAVILCFGARAKAQQGTGALTGTIIDNATRKPLAGALVTVRSPALQEAQLAVTDDAGFYRVPGLPPGTYSVTYDMNGYFPNERAGIEMRADATLRINVGMAVAEGQSEDVSLTVRPTVDVGSSSQITTLDKDLIRRVPVAAPGGKGAASRSFESVAEVAPGAARDVYGTSVSGASSPENHYAIDGLSVSSPGKGTLGTQLSSEFVEEVTVINAGYMPEFGRATGGVLNVVTKSGSNNFHGSFFTFVSPGALEGKREPVRRDAVPVTYDTKLSYVGDIGFDLGGPIIKDKLWFYAGFDVSQTKYNIRRSIYRNRVDPMTGKVTLDTDGGPIYGEDYAADSRTLQGMGKLTWSVNPDNRVSLAVYGTPTKSGGGATFDGQNVKPGTYSIDPLTGRPEVGGGNSPNGTYGATAHEYSSTPIDASLKWNSQFLGKRLLLDVTLGGHFQDDSNRAADGSSAIGNSGLGSYYNVNFRRQPDMATGRRRHQISEFEQFPTASRCDEAGFNCDTDWYSTGAPRDLNEAVYRRYVGSAIVSYLATLWGHHMIKAGFETEYTSFENQKSNRVFTESEDGTQFNDEERFGLLVEPDKVSFIDPLRKKTGSLTVGGFLQDSWTVFDKVTVNLGFRYDTQYFYKTDGGVGLSLPNQWSPRLGLIYDPTQSGKAKLFVNYARYYENAPLGFADVVLVGEPQVRGGHVCDPRIYSQQHNECQAPQNLRRNTQQTPRLPNQTFTTGGNTGTLDPNIEASSVDEFSGGGEYELLPDARVGVTFTQRRINRWIEDMNPNVGFPGFVGNPGYGLGSSFPAVQRNYRAVTAFLMKNFSQGWLAQASYRWATLRGNYAGLFAHEDNYLGPNGTADFDSPNVIYNRYGYLSNDKRHTLKVLAARDWQLMPNHNLGTGIAATAQSGGATSFLAADPNTYPRMTYLTQRGTGPRLPWTFGVDISLNYRIGNLGGLAVSGTLDVFNAFNFQQKVAINEEYTNSNVVATDGYKGRPEDLTNTEGKRLEEVRSPSYGQVTQYQEPRVFRFGLRGEF